MRFPQATHGRGDKGLTVALLGADGAGKSTIGRRLVEVLDVPTSYVYMGINLDASNVVLPTTRLLLEVKRWRGGRPDMASGPPDPNRVKERPRGLPKRALVGCKRVMRILNVMAEEWFRQVVIWRCRRRGGVVVLDRHFFFDYYAADIEHREGLPLMRRLHGYLLERWYPRPDVVIVLDAPAEVLLARKGEGTLELLDLRREDYLRLRHEARKGSAIVDATQSEDRVLDEVAEHITSAMF